MKSKSYKNVRKVLYCSLIALVMLAFGVSMGILIKDRIDYTNTWQYHATYDFEQTTETNEDGEEITVFKVSTPEQLAGAFNTLEKEEESVKAESVNDIIGDDSLVSNKNGVISLTGNIDFGSGSTKNWSWNPVKLSPGKTLNGNGYTISNLKVKKADSSSRVGFLSLNQGVVMNINFDKVTVQVDSAITSTTSTHTAGVVAARNEGTITLVAVTNSTISGVNPNSNGQSRTVKYGGIAGENTIAITSCFANVSVSGGTYIGGIAGDNTGVIQNCNNTGTIKSEGNSSKRFSSVYAGGIAGKTSGTITLSLNSGQVTAKGKDNSYAGGIVGYSTVQITKCGNDTNATVTAGHTTNNAKSYAGGIIGYSNASGAMNCYNKASVYAYAFTQDSGIKSKYPSKNDYDYKLYDFTDDVAIVLVYNQWRRHSYFYMGGPKGNTKETTGRTTYTTPAYAGGIIGYASKSSCVVKNCYNIGNVDGGGVEYKDKYAYVMLYEQYHNQASILGYTKYGRHSTRVYYDEIRYTYEVYHQPIIGYVAGTGNIGTKQNNALSNNLGTQSHVTDWTYDYNADSYRYYKEGFNPWSFLGGIGLLTGAFGAIAYIAVGVVYGLTIANLFTSADYTGSPSAKYQYGVSGTKTITLDGDSKPFDIYQSNNKAKNLKQEFKVTSANGGLATVNMQVTLNGSVKTIGISDFNTKGDSKGVQLNQYVPATGKYKDVGGSYDMQKTSVANTLGSSIWAQNSNKNGGYPYIKDMFWA